MTEIIINIPEITPIYPLREMVAFPYMVFPVFLHGDEVAAFEECVNFNNMVTLVKLKNEPDGEIYPALHEIGTICNWVCCSIKEVMTAK